MTYQYEKRELDADTLTPIAIFNSLKGERKFILESSSNHESKGRYSFIGMNPFKEIIGTDDRVEIKSLGEVENVKAKPLDLIKQHIPNVDLDLPFAFYGGAVGYVGYDTIRLYEEIGTDLDDEINMPDVHFMIYQDVLIFDHQKQSLTIIAVDMSKTRDKTDLLNTLDQIEQQIMTNQYEEEKERSTLNFKPTMDPDTFVKKVEEAKEYIKAGEVSQIVLSQRMKADLTVDPFHLYRRLRLTNPSPYMYYLDFGEYIVLGTSPESLLKTKGKKLITNPIAGTRPRGTTGEEDQMLAEELMKDPKELAEHEMLVELSKEDLKKICKIESIQVPTYMMIERYQHVMHIVSEVTGMINDELSALDALVALLPAGTVSGSPKTRAMQLINEFESVKRGVYAGTVGYINMNGDLDLAIAIRTMVIKSGHAYVQAGAGIVNDSIPANEHLETLNKAKSLVEITLQR